MEMTFNIHPIKEAYKKNFIPKKEYLSNFESWGLIKAYCELYDLYGPYCVSDSKLQETCVWNGNDLYNVSYQITKDDGDSRLWLTENNILMLEVYYKDERPSKLYRCD